MKLKSVAFKLILGLYLKLSLGTYLNMALMTCVEILYYNLLKFTILIDNIILMVTTFCGMIIGSPVFRGSDVLDEVPLIDGHNDLAWGIYMLENNLLENFELNSELSLNPVWNTWNLSRTDLPRLRRGKFGGQFWAAYVDCATTINKDAVEKTMDQIDIIKRFIAKYPYDFQFATTVAGVWEAFHQGRIASLIGVEGGHSIDNRYSVLRLYYELGVRYMTLTHTCDLPWGSASPTDVDPEGNPIGLTNWGKNLVREMNRLGMMVDLSHVSHEVMLSALDVSVAPVIFSHSSSWQVNNHHRNVRDDILIKLKANNGIIMINFYPDFIGGDDIYKVIEHINHVKNLIGPDYIGVGGDYDGVDKAPIGLEDVSKYPDLFDKLAAEFNWSRDDLKKLASLNILRVMKDVEEVKLQLLNEVPKEGDVPYEELDDRNPEKDYSCRTDFEQKYNV